VIVAVFVRMRVAVAVVIVAVFVRVVPVPVVPVLFFCAHAVRLACFCVFGVDKLLTDR